MTETGGVIEGGGIRIESSEETAEQMLASVAPPKDEPTKFKAVKPEGEKEEKSKSAISEAASKLGKKGAQAAAKARAAKGETEEAEEPAKEAPEKPKAPAGESEEPEEEEEDTDPEVRKSRAAERVKEATRKEAEAKREAARLKAENEELRKARPARAREEIRAEPERPKAPEKPKADQFENYEDYLDARDKWNRQEWSREESERAAQRAEREQIIGTVKTFQEAVKEAVEEDPEFWDKVPEIHDSTPLGQEIVRAGKNAPAILLHLAENPKVYDRLSKISDLREVIREVGKIEARLEGATAGNPSSDEHPGPNPEISRARPPARPVAASPHIASGDSKEPDENAPLSAFVADFGRRRQASRR